MKLRRWVCELFGYTHNGRTGWQNNRFTKEMKGVDEKHGHCKILVQKTIKEKDLKWGKWNNKIITRYRLANVCKPGNPKTTRCQIMENYAESV